MTLNSLVTTSDIEAVQTQQQHSDDALPFSKALEKTGFGIFNYSLIFLCGLIIASGLYETASISFILPIAECDLKMTNQDKGILSAIGYVGIIVSSHLWGFLADTKGRRVVMMPALLISSAVSVLSSFSHSFWMLLILRFVNGFFISAPSATIYAYIGEFHSDRTRTRVIMASSSIFSIGAMSLPVVAWSVLIHDWSLAIDFLGIVYKPWRLFIIACACPSIVAGIMFLLFPESPKFLLSIGKEEEAIKALKQMYKWNGKKGDLMIGGGIIPETETTVHVSTDCSIKSSSLMTAFLHTMWKQTAPLFEKTLLLSTVLTCTIQFWLYVTIHGMFMWYPYMTDAMVEFRMQNPGNISRICDVVYAKQAQHHIENSFQHCTGKLEDPTFVYSFMMELFYGLGFVVIGILAKAVKKTHILFVILVAFGTCGLMTNFIFDTISALIVYNMFFLSGVGIQVLSGITVELYPTNLRAMALCISLMFGRLGGVVGANIAGMLLANNCEMTFYIAGTGLIASAGLTFLIPKVNISKDEKTDVQ